MASRFVSVTLGPNDDGRRLDRVARKAFPGLPLSRIYSAIRSGDIRLNGHRVKGEARVAAGDSLGVRDALVTAPPVSRRPAGGPVVRSPSTPTDVATGLEGRIVFQSPHLLVVAKHRGELVHGPHSLETLVQRHLGDSIAPGVSFRPGPVHRLDRNTTGLVVFAASLRGAQVVSRALRSRHVDKRYAAVLSGVVTGEQRWSERLTRDDPARRTTAAQHSTDRGDAPVGEQAGSKSALTIVKPIAVRDNRSLVVATIVTGRTHQIRAHAQAHGTPLLGDRKYGGPPLAGGYILHAGALAISEPNEAIGFRRLWTPLPTSAEERVRTLFGAGALRTLYRELSDQPLR